MRLLILSAVLLLLAVTAASDTTYEIGYGDTLWDLSIYFFGTPDYWDEILQANSQVEDQYSLIPGQILVIPGIGESAIYTQQFISSDQGIYNASSEPLLSRLRIETAGMVAVDPIVPLGYVLVSNVEEEGIYANDNAYTGDLLEIDLGGDKGVEIGNVFHIINSGEMVRDPETGGNLGRVMRTAGVCRVIGTTPSTSIVKLEHAYRMINSGDLIVPYRTAANIVVNNNPVMNDLTAYVLAFRDQDLESAYTFDVIYLNRGINDGISPGDVFTAYKYGREMWSPSGERVHTADIPIADVVILTAERSTCAALVVMSRTADIFFIGDRLHLTGSQSD